MSARLKWCPFLSSFTVLLIYLPWCHGVRPSPSHRALACPGGQRSGRGARSCLAVLKGPSHGPQGNFQKEKDFFKMLCWVGGRGRGVLLLRSTEGGQRVGLAGCGGGQRQVHGGQAATRGGRLRSSHPGQLQPAPSLCRGRSASCFLILAEWLLLRRMALALSLERHSAHPLWA